MCHRAHALIFLLALILVMDANATPRALTVTSSAFRAGGMIPKKYGCSEDRGINPRIAWSKVPANTRSIAIVMDDLQWDQDQEEAGGPGARFHWGLYNITKATRAIPLNFSSSKVSSSRNDSSAGYLSVCPPYHATHEYSFRVYALDTSIPKRAYRYARDLYNALTSGALQSHIVAQGSLNGRYYNDGSYYAP